ncbi:SLAM family member 8-like, partial [Clarias magur]
MYKATGSSLDLTVKYPKDTVSSVEWRFNGKRFAEYSKSKAYSHLKSQFTERIKDDNDKVGITLQDLQLQDSGTFSMVIEGTEKQQPTEEFTVYIQSPLTAVQIEKNQTWKVSTNSCDVDVKCAALGAESVSYLWSGYKTGSGAQLQFSLSPAEGNVTLNCTATNNVSNITATETLNCKAVHLDTVLIFDVEVLLLLISSLVTASPYLLVTIILGVKCYRSQ